MKIYLYIMKFLFIGSLFIVSNNNEMIDPTEFNTFGTSVSTGP